MNLASETRPRNPRNLISSLTLDYRHGLPHTPGFSVGAEVELRLSCSQEPAFFFFLYLDHGSKVLGRKFRGTVSFSLHYFKATHYIVCSSCCWPGSFWLRCACESFPTVKLPPHPSILWCLEEVTYISLHLESGSYLLKIFCLLGSDSFIMKLLDFFF